MAKTNILIACPMERHNLARVENVSTELDLICRQFQAREDMTPYLAHRGEILLTYRASFDPAAAPRLRWIQLTGAGADHLQSAPIMKSDVVITNAHLFATPIAEYVFGSILCHSRKFPRMLSEFQKMREWPSDPWKTHVSRELNKSTLGIAGYGDIGRAIARISQGFGSALWRL
jgi:phosphoglycerate dehydrogenase-like enzyme